MPTYYKELSWDSDYTWLRDNISTWFDNHSAGDVDFGRSIQDPVLDMNDSIDQRYASIRDRFNLKDHCYIMNSTPAKKVHDPHRHDAEDTFVSLVIPVEGCDSNTVTSWLEPNDSDYSLATDTRTTNCLHPDEAYTVLETTSVASVPVVINNRQWHKVESNDNVTKRVTFVWPTNSAIATINDY